MSEGAITSAPARAWASAWRVSAATLSSLTNPVARHQAVVAVAGVGVERHVSDEAEPGEFLLDRAAGAADQVVLVERLAALLVLQRRVGVGEKSDRRDVELNRPFGFAHRLLEAEALDAGHRGDRRAGLATVGEKQRPDQVVD